MSPRSYGWCPAATMFFGSRSGSLSAATSRPSATIPCDERKLSSSVTVRTPALPLDERQDVGHRAAAPLVDRLVVVADHAQVRAEPAEPLDQLLLDRVRVLVLVHDDVPDVIADVPDKRPGDLVVGVLAEQVDRDPQQLGEVEVVLLREQLPVPVTRRDQLGRQQRLVHVVLAEDAQDLHPQRRVDVSPELLRRARSPPRR